MTSVLVIEDHPFLRDSYVQVLRNANYEVDAAATREEALEKIRCRTYDVALVDIMLREDLSDRAGIEILRTLQKLNEGTRSIVVTAHDEMDVAIHSFQTGVVDVLRKHRIMAPAKEVAEAVGRAAEGVQHPLYGKYASLHALLAAPELVPYWESSLISTLGCDYHGLTDALKRAFTPFLPVLRPIKVKDSLAVARGARTADGAFWSKKTGYPIWVAFAAKDAEPVAPPVGQEGEVLYERDKGAVKIRLSRLLGRSRDEFYETLAETP